MKKFIAITIESTWMPIYVNVNHIVCFGIRIKDKKTFLITVESPEEFIVTETIDEVIKKIQNVDNPTQ